MATLTDDRFASLRGQGYTGATDGPVLYNPITGEFCRVTAHRESDLGLVRGTGQHGYPLIRYNGKQYKAHRLAWFLMTGSWPVAIDHINGDRADNRWDNLRIADRRVNARNMALRSTNTTGISGVRWCKRDGLYCADIRNNDNGTDRLYTKDFFDACCWRKSAELRLGYHHNHGEKRVNFSRR